MFLVRRSLVGAILIGALCAVAPSPKPQRSVVVTSVVGLHQGKCSPRRAAEVQAAIARLAASDFAWANHCKCNPKTHDQILANERLIDGSLKADRQLNVISIDIAAPITLPDAKLETMKAQTVQLVAKALPGDHQTILWVGHEPVNPRRDITFFAYIFPGDPFRLTLAPGQECGT